MAKDSKKANKSKSGKNFEFDAANFSKKTSASKTKESILFPIYKYAEDFYYYMMDDKFIPISKLCETMNVSRRMKAFRMMLAFLAVFIIIYQVSHWQLLLNIYMWNQLFLSQLILLL